MTKDKESINLLSDAVMTIRSDGGDLRTTLPGLYAMAARGEDAELTAIRPHQRHAVHATLCQIGAIALISAGLTECPDSPEAWWALLNGLTEQEFPGQEPWQMVVADITMPAFLQPPVTRPELADQYRRTFRTPDEIDLTVGSKRHDVKDGRIQQAEPEHWLYALINCQCAGGFEGAWVYGVSRMNQGYGNRHGFSVTPNTRTGPHLRRDIDTLAMNHRRDDVAGHLLWTRSWDGTAEESIGIEQMATPALYVEAGKRMRLIRGPDGRIHAARATSRSARIDPAETKGRTEDPWTVTTDQKAVTIGGNGFPFGDVAQYLDPAKFHLPELARPHPTDGDELHLIGRAMTRGKGGTDGYHEIDLPVGPRMTGMLRTRTGRQALAGEAAQRAAIVGEVSRLLEGAVRMHLLGGAPGGDLTKGEDKVLRKATSSLQADVEQDFWEALDQGLATEDQESARARWTWEMIVPRGRRALRQVQAGACRGGLDRFRARARSNDSFEQGVRRSRKLPDRPAPQEEQY